MAFVSTNINIGHLQGILVGDIYSPRSNLALLTIKVKAEKREPGTNRRKLHFPVSSITGRRTMLFSARSLETKRSVCRI